MILRFWDDSNIRAVEKYGRVNHMAGLYCHRYTQ